MRQPASVHHRRTHPADPPADAQGESCPDQGGAGPRTAKRRCRADWPFLYSYEKGNLYINPIRQRTAYQQASDVGTGLF